ncbi:DTW domain-containing protein [Vibrio sp. S9_S30]|uniref:tRNA-uridine aminocarboxypropyltransferase n=1 Tax=Vibrio sp. S9_S30 TaxID=2720226 RepID=UPI0016807851|nr:tRNA-uridine aminocarboxypropyltransferase [Vibrio sp. S9_S30]MBD1556888.1 DTW domain-containing protein [Vibrio sp. S9_S30]
MRIHQVHRLYQSRLDRATKPFNARGSKVVRCQFCQVTEQHCICSHQPNIQSNVSAVIIMSDNEILKPSNTGRLIADTLEDTHAFQWSRTEPEQALLALLNNDKYLPVIIFPEDYVDEKSRLIQVEDLVTQVKLTGHGFSKDTDTISGKKALLIFLDGSWREARKMFRKSDYLAHLPVLSVNPDTVSNYMMRKSDNENHLATAEVASLVLNMLGDFTASKTLSLWFEAFKEGYLLSKTRLKHDLSKPMLAKYTEYSKNIEQRVTT